MYKCVYKHLIILCQFNWNDISVIKPQLLRPGAAAAAINTADQLNRKSNCGEFTAHKTQHSQWKRQNSSKTAIQTNYTRTHAGMHKHMHVVVHARLWTAKAAAAATGCAPQSSADDRHTHTHSSMHHKRKVLHEKPQSPSRCCCADASASLSADNLPSARLTYLRIKSLHAVGFSRSRLH